MLNATGEMDNFVHDPYPGITDAAVDLDSMNHYFNHMYAGGAEQDKEWDEIMAMDDRAQASRLLAEILCALMEDGQVSNWKAYLSDAEEEYDNSAYRLTDEEKEALEEYTPAPIDPEVAKKFKADMQEMFGLDKLEDHGGLSIFDAPGANDDDDDFWG